MTKAARVSEVCRILDEMYGTEKIIYLEHENTWQLLFATILSAQCTDARVNLVTRDLYQKYTSLEDFANADLAGLEEDIHSTGFYHNKAKNIIACARRLLNDFGGEVPTTIEELTSLPGVGRKTANVIRGNVFEDPSIVVDTHVKRISKRLGLTKKDDPTEVEFELMKVLPKEHWIRYNMQIITLGRTICPARKPHCGECPLYEVCTSRGKF
ncbi:MAG: endonuclease III [Lachnospiraceae bacterium]|nr:endonuclease III [Lachnospiraceae bacterium]